MKALQSGLTLILFFFCTYFSYSQPICGFDTLHRKALSTSETYRKAVQENETHLQELIQKRAARAGNARGMATNAPIYTIPVVVHVVHTGNPEGTAYNPSDAQIIGAIDYLNQMFNGTYPGLEGVGDIQIQFRLATRDINCNPTNGIHRINGVTAGLTNYATNGVNASTSGGTSDLELKNSSRWDPYQFYNIWVVNRIDGADGTAGQFIAGYAMLAGGSPVYDGTVMLATQMIAGAKTLPHEIGHALNLYHPFQGSSGAGVCPPNTPGNCANEGDRVCDTDPISYNATAGVVDFSCRSGANACAGGNPYSINTEHNVMNYTNCFTLFTADQKARMLSAMSLPIRRELAQSWAASATYPVTPYAQPALGCIPDTDPVGTSDYYAGILNVSLANKSFYTGFTIEDNGYLNQTDRCNNLISLQANGTYTISTTLVGANREQVKAWIDYNNNGNFESNETILSRDSLANSLNMVVNRTFTVPSTAVQGTVVRMRVLEDISSEYGAASFTMVDACYDPFLGQGEDYAVVISPSILPATMEYFKGQQQGSINKLFWKTSAEMNTDVFEVERSYDGVEYTKIGTVEAMNQQGGAYYSLDDNQYSGSLIHYRLKQIDYSGFYIYTNVVTIKVTVASEESMMVLTNPFRTSFEMNIASPVASKAVIKLFNVTGKLVHTQTNAVSGSTLVKVAPNAQVLSGGVYIVQVQLNGATITRKLIKE